MKLNILLTTGIISLALLSGCDKDSEQPTNTLSGEIAIPAPTTAPEAPEAATDPAYEETTAPDSEATTAPAETATPATK